MQIMFFPWNWKSLILNSLADGTLLDPGRLDQQEKLVKNFFGGEDQSVGQNEKELDGGKIELIVNRKRKYIFYF